MYGILLQQSRQSKKCEKLLMIHSLFPFPSAKQELTLWSYLYPILRGSLQLTNNSPWNTNVQHLLL